MNSGFISITSMGGEVYLVPFPYISQKCMEMVLVKEVLWGIGLFSQCSVEMMPLTVCTS